MDDNKETGERAESVISDILISDSCVENIIACIDSYEISSMENKLQSLSESDPRQESLVMDHGKEPVPHSSRCSVNSLNLSQDKTQPPSEPDQYHETQLLDMDQIKERVLPSSRCSVNSLNLSQDKTQPPSEPDQYHETQSLDMDQSKEPVLPSSRCSVNSLNLSQGSTQSTLPPPASQSSSGLLLSLRNNTYGKDIQAYGKSITKQPKRQRHSNTMSEVSKIKQIKEIHKHLYQSLKNSSVLTQSDKNLLANAKQMLFSIKLHHAVLCESLKADCMRKVPSNNKCRESLKKRISLLQSRQHKLLLLFQEHNVITKKIKMLDYNRCKEAEVAAKGQPMLSRKNLPSFSQDKTFAKNFEPESESASTIYSLNCSQKKKPKIKKRMKVRDGSVLRKSQQPISQSSISKSKMNQSSQQPMSESVIRSNDKMNLFCQQPMSESVIKSDNKMNLSCQQPTSESAIISDNKINQSSQQPMSELAIISGNKTNLSAQQPMSESAMISKTKFPNGSKQTSSCNIANRILKLDSKSSSCPSLQNKNATSDDDSASSLANTSANFTATPIGTIADFTQNIQPQHDFSNDRLVTNSAVTSPYQQLQIPPATNQHPQNVPVSSLRDDIFCTSTNSQSATANAVGSFEKYEKTKEVGKLRESTEEKTKSLTDKASFDKIYLTHINLIEDEELVPLDRILPSCQNMDIFANISFPKFLWEGFHKWP